MAAIFYPYEDELNSSTLEQKLEVLLESAQRFKAAVLDAAVKTSEATGGSTENKKRTTPRDIVHVYNWEEIARLLHQIRELPESSPISKKYKADRLKKLAEIYEVLRAAKMAKLEAVRIALMNEADQLRSDGTQVA
ncbi:MAG: hypothetical protein ABI597_11105 [Gammaproteobacteria bacterium]